jgi:hypothetical protein
MSTRFVNNGGGDASCRSPFWFFREFPGSSRMSEALLDVAGGMNFDGVSVSQAEHGLDALDLIADQRMEARQHRSESAVPLPVESRSSAPELTSRSESEVFGWKAPLRPGVVSRVSNCTMSQREEVRM